MRVIGNHKWALSLPFDLYKCNWLLLLCVKWLICYRRKSSIRNQWLALLLSLFLTLGA